MIGAGLSPEEMRLTIRRTSPADTEDAAAVCEESYTSKEENKVFGHIYLSKGTQHTTAHADYEIDLSLPFKDGTYVFERKDNGDVYERTTVTLQCLEPARKNPCDMDSLIRTCEEKKLALLAVCQMLHDWMLVVERSDREEPEIICADGDCGGAIAANERRGREEPFTSVDLFEDNTCSEGGQFTQFVYRIQIFGWE